MEIQDLESLNTFIIGQIRRSPNARLVTLFTHCRELNRINFIGDLPLLMHIVELYYEHTKKRFSRWELLKALNNSMEFKIVDKSDKTEILTFLQTAQNDEGALKKVLKSLI